MDTFVHFQSRKNKRIKKWQKEKYLFSADIDWNYIFCYYVSFVPKIEENVSDNETVFSVHVSPGVVLSFLCIFLLYMLAKQLP